MINIVNDSRIIKEGDIFILEEKGLEFLPQVLLKKPSKIIADKKLAQLTDLPNISFFNNKNEIISLLKKHYQVPKNIYAITGTNGKTSTTSFVSQLLKFTGFENVSIGTMGINSTKAINFDIEINNTTPSIFNLYRILHTAKENGIDHVVFEASSHGLIQGRIDGITIDCAAFTNITHDHLDYHGTIKNYLHAKSLLFSKYLKGTAVINTDDPCAPTIKEAASKNHIIEYGKSAKDIKILSTNFIAGGFNVDLEIYSKKYTAFFPVVADFQIYNICAALGLLIKNNNIENLLKAVPMLNSPIGRMQEVKNSKIFVDYAHTPDALEKALLTLKQISINKKLVVVFGCGGDRDRTKRPIMGKIASSIADVVIVTDDNPRTENPDVIRSEIIAQVDPGKVIEIGDRLKAIDYVIKNYYPSAIILIAGKGHENYQIIGDQTHYFSDQETVLQLIL